MDIVDGVTAPALPIAAGARFDVPLVVTAQDGVTKGVYKVVVDRAPSTLDGLASLVPSEGQMRPMFSADTRTYLVQGAMTRDDLREIHDLK